jgi:transposase
MAALSLDSSEGLEQSSSLFRRASNQDRQQAEHSPQCAADLLQEYEAKIAALERMVGRQALEIEFLKGALKSVPRPRSASTSVFTGPTASPSPKDAA